MTLTARRLRFLRYLHLFLAAVGSAPVPAFGQDEREADPAIVWCDHANFVFSPYAWKRTGNDGMARAEAALPGAYLRATFSGTSAIALLIDGAANKGCPSASMPVIEYSIDEGPYQVVQLIRTESTYPVGLAKGLEPHATHRVEVYLRASDLLRQRWTEPTSRLRVAGFQVDASAVCLTTATHAKRAIAYGDSITEGVGADGLFSSWQQLEVNNARATWFPLVAAALDCEYGQLGSGGQGMSRGMELPPLTQTWNRYDSRASRLTGKRLLPEPDYIFCAMGTNDFDVDITKDYIAWLSAMRDASPNSHFFCIVPPLGVHASEIAAAVAARRHSDVKVHLIDTKPLHGAFRAGQGATQLAYDGVHPSAYGQARLAALIAAEVVKVIGCP